jgi:hypothetical protein
MGMGMGQAGPAHRQKRLVGAHVKVALVHVPAAIERDQCLDRLGVGWNGIDC